MRLFIAINFSPEIKAMLLQSIAGLQAQSSGGNFTREENLHLTLAFIGETGRLQPIRAAMEAAAGPPFELVLKGSGRFGQLYWVGVEESPALLAQAESLREQLRRQGVSFDAKPFKPHITVARQVRSERPLSVDAPRCSMRAERLSLMSSERVQGRLMYREVYACPLERK